MCNIRIRNFFKFAAFASEQRLGICRVFRCEHNRGMGSTKPRDLRNSMQVDVLPLHYGSACTCSHTCYNVLKSNLSRSNFLQYANILHMQLSRYQRILEMILPLLMPNE